MYMEITKPKLDVSKTMKLKRWAITISKLWSSIHIHASVSNDWKYTMALTLQHMRQRMKRKEMLLLLLLNSCSKKKKETNKGESTLIDEIYFNGLMSCRWLLSLEYIHTEVNYTIDDGLFEECYQTNENMAFSLLDSMKYWANSIELTAGDKLQVDLS